MRSPARRQAGGSQSSQVKASPIPGADRSGGQVMPFALLAHLSRLGSRPKAWRQAPDGSGLVFCGPWIIHRDPSLHWPSAPHDHLHDLLLNLCKNLTARLCCAAGTSAAASQGWAACTWPCSPPCTASTRACCTWCKAWGSCLSAAAVAQGLPPIPALCRPSTLPLPPPSSSSCFCSPTSTRCVCASVFLLLLPDAPVIQACGFELWKKHHLHLFIEGRSPKQTLTGTDVHHHLLMDQK